MTPNLSCSKNRKWKIKEKEKSNKREKIKMNEVYRQQS